MPLTTNLSVSPYFDDYDNSDNYYKILFKPATAVQVREMNQLQTILQNQIEEFGDHVLKSGSVLDGCQFSFKPSIPYAKILDSTTSGAAIRVADYQGYYVEGKNSGVVAEVTHTISGFEGDANDELNTLYLNYVGSGPNNNKNVFEEGETLKIYNNINSLFDVNIALNGASQGFSNSDILVILSAVRVQNVVSADTTGLNYQIGDVLENIDSTVEVVVYDTPVVDEETQSLILPIRPQYTDLAPVPNKDKWENITVGETELILTGTPNIESKVVGKIGTGATGTFSTTRTGTISTVSITRGGSGYTTLPYVSIYSTVASTSQVTALDLNAIDYLAEVTVASSANFSDPLGYGYGVNVSSGKIYQKGYFLNVASQFAIISKYSNTPSDLAVGFSTSEEIINATTDTALYDNAQGFLNFAAPGASRLKLTPIIATKTKAQENSDPEFLPLIRFSEGRPFSQNRLTQYNKLGDMIAQRTYEESGNYTLDKFQVQSRSTVDIANSDTHFSYVIDPGHAYISGYRVKTDQVYAKNVEKAKEVTVLPNQTNDLIYHNYIKVNNLRGVHTFQTGQEIELYDTATNYYANFDNYNNGGGVINYGNQIGTAKIRSVVHESGIQGTADAIYRIHIFDLSMDGKNIRNIRSIYVPQVAGGDGSADAYLTSGNDSVLRQLKTAGEAAIYDPQVYTQYAEINLARYDSLVLDLRLPTTVIGSGNNAITNLDYQYRSTQSDLTVTAAGQISVSTPDAFPYIGQLSDTEENTLIVVPEVDIQLASFVTGVTLTAVVGTDTTELTSSVVTTTFAADLKPGDYITDGSKTSQVISVDGQNKITIRNTTASWAGSGITLSRIFPADVPIPLANRSEMTATVAGSTMTISLGSSLSGGDIASAVSVTYNTKSNNTSTVQMTATRNVYVKVSSASLPACLGVPGVFRLRKVYDGTTTSDTDITNQFFVENGQTSSYWGLSYIHRNKKATGSLAAELLVQFDYFVPGSSGGLKTIDSYNINDEVPLSSLTTDCNILEVPSFVDKAGMTHWLRECLDFRPFINSTVTPNSVAGSAPLVSSSTEVFPSSSNLRFPIPQGDVEFDSKYYDVRTDSISVSIDGTFDINVGTKANIQKDKQKLELYKSFVAAYPSLPRALSANVRQIINTRVYSQNKSTNFSNYQIKIVNVASQNGGYTMEDISKLESRINILEYNQNLSKLQDQTKDIKIPSTIDETLERFKYGFFVDNFTNYLHTNQSSEQHTATIYDYKLYPAKSTFSLQLKPGSQTSKFINGNKVSFPFTRRLILSQENATYGPYVAPPPPPVIELFNQFITSSNRNYINKSVATYTELRNVWEEITFIGADSNDGVTRNIELKFYNPDGGIAYEIIQSNVAPTSKTPEQGTEIFSSASAGIVQNLSASEAFTIYQKFYDVKDGSNDTISPDINAWFSPRSESTITTTDPAKTYTTQKGAGKITVNYNPDLGKYITVRVIKGKPVFNFEISYPVITAADAVYDSGSTSVDTTPPCPAKGGYRYEKCVGPALVTYVHDGLCGTAVGSTVPNSPSCIEPDPPEADPGPQPCPASGTYFKDACQGDNKVTYTYTGVRSDDGTCETQEDSSEYSTDCAPPATDPTPVVDPEPVVPDPVDDGGTKEPDPPIDPPPEDPPVVEPDPPTTGCFIAGTKILMADGTEKNIEDIQVGDIVISMIDNSDLHQEDWTSSYYRENNHSTVTEVYDLTTESREMWTINNKLTFTNEHPIATTNGWKCVNPSNWVAKDNVQTLSPDQFTLTTGDNMLVVNEGSPTVFSTLDSYDTEQVTSLTSNTEVVKVYNFKCEPFHTYVANRVIVHNKDVAEEDVDIDLGHGWEGAEHDDEGTETILINGPGSWTGTITLPINAGVDLGPIINEAAGIGGETGALGNNDSGSPAEPPADDNNSSGVKINFSADVDVGSINVSV